MLYRLLISQDIYCFRGGLPRPHCVAAGYALCSIDAYGKVKWGAAHDRTLQCLAFAQGRLLWIHPFEDFNGRLTRVLLADLLQRLDMPALDPTPDPGPDTERYLQALEAADWADWGSINSHARSPYAM